MVSIVVIAASQVGQPAVGAFWGPAIGLTIRDRLDDARGRADAGRDTSRRALLGPAWLEPVLALVLTSFAVGLSLLVGALLDDAGIAVVATGIGLCLTSALAGLAVLLHGRRAHRGRTAAADDGGTSVDVEST